MHAGGSRFFASLSLNRPSRLFLVPMVVAVALLAGCASRSTRAPITSMTSGQSVPTVSSGGTYVVKPGATLYKIASEHSMEVSELERLNNITDPKQLRVGTTLRLSGGAPAPRKAEPLTPVPLPVTPVTTSAPASAPKASDAGLLSWGWPAEGKIIQSFNANTKGIDIAGKEGDPVRAAADGEVMYAGNGVRGLGNLVLIKHGNGFITAYAHNKQLLVKTGEHVRKGTKIATLGQTDTTSPRLHFEIRRHGTPVNPLSYLPPR
jgi:lipoprotein NlpD